MLPTKNEPKKLDVPDIFPNYGGQKDFWLAPID
jgi:hypothetical protein